MKVNFLEKNGKKIKCEYSKRRNSRHIKIRVDNSRVVKISLPYYTPYFAAKGFVKKNIDWIEQKLKLYENQGSSYYYLGKNIRVIKKYRANIKSFNYLFNDSILTFETSNLTISEEDLFTAWVRQRAEEYIPKKVEEFALKLGFKYNSVKIKKLSAQWGSCSFDKNLSFNLKLMYFNRKVIDYVIIHELCHLKIMDHSKRFWNLVEKVMPDYNKYRLQLNTLIH